MTAEASYMLHRITLMEFELQKDGSPSRGPLMDMNTPIEDIKSRFEHLSHLTKVKKDVIQAKRALNLCIECMTFMAESTMGIDMKEWQQDTHWALTQGKAYDEVIEELCVKYGGSRKFPPEARLMFMLLLSFGSGILQKNAMEKLMRARASSPPEPKCETPKSDSTPSNFLNRDDLSAVLSEIRKAVAGDDSSSSGSSSSSSSSTWDNAAQSDRDDSTVDESEETTYTTHHVIDGYNSF